MKIRDEQDDEVRNEYGVLASVRQDKSGRAYIVLDDLKRASSNDRLEWRHWSFYTHVDVGSRPVEECDFEPKDYEALGRLVLTRLRSQQRSQRDRTKK